MSKLTKKQREDLFQKYNGRCAYCGETLQKGWHADHIEPIRRNGDGTCLNPERELFDNYNPSCASCNINKHSMSLEDFRKSISKYVESLNNYSVQYRMAKKYGLVIETSKEVSFYFETLNDRDTPEHKKVKELVKLAQKIKGGYLVLLFTFSNFL